jgi:hypothetical protein
MAQERQTQEILNLNLPFFFRIYSPNGQGIIYRADKCNGDSYMCTGSRQIGKARGARGIIWEVGGYSDAMPREAMDTIIKTKPMTNSQKNAFLSKNKLGSKYKSMTLYSDSHGYWFSKKLRYQNITN